MYTFVHCTFIVHLSFILQLVCLYLQVVFYVIGNCVLLHKKPFGQDAHLATENILLRNPLGREIVSMLTIYSRLLQESRITSSGSINISTS